MSLKDDLLAEIQKTFAEQWQEQSTASIPSAEELRLNANHAKNLDYATVLYADLNGSTSMVNSYKWWFSAEIYKVYLRCAGAIIKSEDGIITAYDGDRIMAIFTGKYKNTQAVKAALKINFSVHKIIRPAIKAQYPDSTFLLNHTIGIDTSELRAARIGVKGDNDLVWIGRAANFAAKLTTQTGSSVWITKAVYEKINNEAKFANDTNMWEPKLWEEMNNFEIYCSNYTWRID